VTDGVRTNDHRPQKVVDPSPQPLGGWRTRLFQAIVQVRVPKDMMVSKGAAEILLVFRMFSKFYTLFYRSPPLECIQRSGAFT
jgi:hypothetical protein